MTVQHFFSFRGLIFSAGALMSASLVLAGCGAKTGESAPPAPGAAAPVEATPVVVAPPAAPDFSATLGKVAAAADMFAWYAAREEYLAGTERSAEVDAALTAKEAELLAASPAKPFNEVLELVAFDWKLYGTASAEGKKENFSIKWLLHKKGPITPAEGEDVQLILRGWPDKAHQHYLEGVGQAENKYFEVSFWLKPPLAEVKAGEYYLVERKTYKVLPNVPYRMHTFFSLMKKKEDGNWGYVARFGELADLGWFADLGQQ